MQVINQTAVLIFSRKAVHESEAKTFVRGRQKANREVAQTLIEHTVQVAKQSQLPTFLHYTDHHSNLCFGAQLADAVETIWQKGYQQVLVLGNDCQDQDSARLVQAAELLDNQHIVLGPDLRGGVYLIGLHRSHYARDRFVALPWRTGLVQSAWAEYAGMIKSQIIWLDAVADINSARDFDSFLAELPKHSSLCFNISKLLQTNPPRISKLSIVIVRHLNDVLGLRGPPLAASR